MERRHKRVKSFEALQLTTPRDVSGLQVQTRQDGEDG